jgi:hypothetical protein
MNMKEIIRQCYNLFVNFLNQRLSIAAVTALHGGGGGGRTTYS